MNPALVLDRRAIARACRERGVRRLQLFGSATGNRCNSQSSDADFLVEFAPGVPEPFDAYFGLKEDLEALLDVDVDLVMTDAVRNPHFAASALAGAQARRKSMRPESAASLCDQDPPLLQVP